MILTEKETMLLNDLKSEEKLCIDKYNKYASQASNSQLKDLFSGIGQIEQQHYDTINQILSGTNPSMNMGSSQKPNLNQSAQTNAMHSKEYGQEQKTQDKYLCSDALGTEKHVSSMYDTCIFEFKDDNLRNTLNHIQKEEQEHGKKLYDYMSQNGMYS